MLIRRTAYALTTTLLMATAMLSAGTARADGDDAETRFHKAYEAEVIDGKLADSARVYLSIAGDTSASARIRAESKFRFAVTAVLLGRADEARTHLEELVADPAISETLRTRSREYLDAARGIGLGTELDRKLQALVFDLGRANPNERVPSGYRDFEVIGKPAIPMLRSLLSHSDGAIRGHAYRLLLRLDEPGMGAMWTPDVALDSRNNTAADDLRAYLARRPEEIQPFQTRILALTDVRLLRLLDSCALAWMSDGKFLRAARDRGVSVASLSRLATISGNTSDSLGAALREWISSSEPQHARAAADAYLTLRFADKLSDAEVDPLFTALVAAYRGDCESFGSAPYDTKSSSDIAKHFLAVAKRAPLGRRIDAVADLIGADDSVVLPESPLANGFARLVGASIESDNPAGDDLTRYTDLLLRAATRLGSQASSATQTGIGHLAPRIEWLLTQTSRDWAVAAATRLFTGGRIPWRGCTGLRARDFEVFAAALRAASPVVRTALWNGSPIVQGGNPTFADEEAAAIVRATPELLRLAIELRIGSEKGEMRLSLSTQYFRLVAVRVPAADAQAALRALIEAASQSDDERWVTQTTYSLVLAMNDPLADGSYHAQVVVPAARSLWPLLNSDSQRTLVDGVARTITAGSPDPAVIATGADFVCEHPAALLGGGVVALWRRDDIAPVERWFGGIDERFAQLPELSPRTPEAARDILTRLMPTPDSVTRSIVGWAKKFCPPEHQRPLFDRVLRDGSLANVTLLVSADPAAGSVSAEAVETACARLLSAGAAAPRFALAGTVRLAATRFPSDRLLPFVRALLQSADTYDAQSGIAAAEQLGTEELLPALGGALDSMNPELRAAARKAIDSIVELQKLRNATK